MPSPSSPSASFHPSSPLRTSTITPGPVSTRFMVPDDDEDEDVVPPNLRTVSYPTSGPSGSSSIAGPSGTSQVSPPPRYVSGATSSGSVPIATPLPQNPRLSRAVTYQSSASLAPPPSADVVRGTDLYRAWREKYVKSNDERPGAPPRQSGSSAGGVDASTANNNTQMMELDPDSNYYKTNERVGGWDDESDDDLDAEHGTNGAFRLLRRPPLLHTPSANDATALPASPEGRERLEWQTMLASVLGGEILKGEKSRIGGERPSNETFRKELGDLMWWQIRARVRGRTEEEERRRVEERRNRVVDSVLEEVERFSIELGAKRKPVTQSFKDVDPKKATDWISAAEDSDDVNASEPKGFEKPASPEAVVDDSKELKENNAMEQVDYILEKLALVESLYPHHLALRTAKSLYNSPEFQARVDALAAWSSVVRTLKAQLSVLQKWTGSDELDITKPNTTKERALVGKNRYHPLDTKARAQAASDQAADDSTFIERVLKEDSLQKTFERRAFVEMTSILYTAKQSVISHLPIFKELGLPDFQFELVRLVSFPGRLIIEALRVRLDAARKLVDPSSMVIDDMIDNFRISISLGVLVKRQYLALAEPDPDRRWKLPYCLREDYDSMILKGIKTFFRLLHWKLKRGGKALYFRETEILENEWEFLYDAASAIEGGDAVVAELFCSLTNKLMVRVTNFFETQLMVPVSSGRDVQSRDSSAARSQRPTSRVLNGPSDNADPSSWQHEKAYMNPELMTNWFSKILDAVKMRYRKLQRFARRLTQRFDNSAEYVLEDENLNAFIDCLHDTGHFLVYTQTFEEQGTYLIADGSLWDRPDAVEHILSQSFSTLALDSLKQRRAPNTLREGNFDYPPEGGIFSSGAEDDGDDDDDVFSYVLLLSPRQRFVWTGAVMPLDVAPVDLCLEDNRVRLIADGPLERLAQCKDQFAECFIVPDSNEPLFELEVVVEQQSHLPRVQRELKKINRSTIRLSECIVISASHVRDMLGRTPGTQDLIENWYMFASEHGHRVGAYMDPADWATFTPLLMQLSISWVSFICDDCDPTDRKTFRWTVNALEYAMGMTRGNNILHLDKHEFALLRSKVASCMTLLISHFDILGARSSIEAKKEAERLEAVRRLQRLQENFDNTDGFLSRTASPLYANHLKQGECFPIDRSIRLVREERLRLIAELEQHRLGLFNDQHLIGQVLDEEVAEDRSLVFLAASTSNIALRWQQGGFIGGGANGNVYIGFNLDSGGIMAVKEIRVQDLSNSPALYKQIKDESDVMQMLSHPNIVDYYGIEVHRDRVYIFEEYCEGGSLANLLEHGRIEDEDVILVYTVQMLEGLVYLHSKGVEHRDVKPDNILIGAGSTIKYVDFGAAKVIIKGNRTMAKTRAANKPRAPGMDGPAAMNSLAGTPMYMAPEVIKNERTTRLGAMDVWSLGCVILEFATGRKPWSNLDNEWAIMFHIGIATQHPPLPEPGQLSEIGIDFIEQCLCLDPADRPTASELLLHPWVAETARQMREHNSPEYSYGQGVSSLSSTITDQLQGRQGNEEEAGDYAEESTIDLSHFNTPVDEEHSGEISMLVP